MTGPHWVNLAPVTDHRLLTIHVDGLCENIHRTYVSSWARLTKAYDVTIQRYRNSHAKIEDSSMFCGVWVQNFV